MGSPMHRDSGPFWGRRMIRGGRPVARQALYMAAWVGSRYNPILKTHYQELFTRGKVKKIVPSALCVLPSAYSPLHPAY